jgi:hypothetical protein
MLLLETVFQYVLIAIKGMRIVVKLKINLSL